MAQRALVIGSGYEPIGVTNNVACMAHVLGDRQFGFGFEVKLLTGVAATRDGILTALATLEGSLSPDDAAIVYYSGHGGLLRTPDYQIGTGIPRFIQYICPTDFDDSSQHDFRGITFWELALHSARLTKRTANVTWIFECCHSTGMSRGVTDEVKAAGCQLRLGELRTQGLAELALADNPKAVHIAAVGAREIAYPVVLPATAQCAEFAPEKQGRIGLLTLSLLEMLIELRQTPVSWHTLAPALRSRVAGRAPEQRPEITGPLWRIPFSLEVTDGTFVPVKLASEDPESCIQIQVGQLAGVEVGDLYGVLAAEATAKEPWYIVHARVTKADPLTAYCRELKWQQSRHELPPNAVATPIEHAYPRQPVVVNAPDVEVPCISSMFADTRKLRLAKPNDNAVLQLTMSNGQTQIFDNIGALSAAQPYPEQLPAQVSTLANLATVNRLRALPSSDGLGSDSATCQLGRVRDGQFIELAPTDEICYVGDSLAMQIYNRLPKTALYANVFSVGLLGAIFPLSLEPSGIRLAPTARATSASAIMLGEHIDGRLIGFKLVWPIGLPKDQRRIDSVLAIFTTEPMDLRMLATKHRSDSGISRGGTALQELVRALDSGRPRRMSRGAAAPYMIQWLHYLLGPTPRVPSE